MRLVNNDVNANASILKKLLSQKTCQKNLEIQIIWLVVPLLDTPSERGGGNTVTKKMARRARASHRSSQCPEDAPLSH
jgi:hypothetical protein